MQFMCKSSEEYARAPSGKRYVFRAGIAVNVENEADIHYYQCRPDAFEEVKPKEKKVEKPKEEEKPKFVVKEAPVKPDIGKTPDVRKEADKGPAELKEKIAQKLKEKTETDK